MAPGTLTTPLTVLGLLAGALLGDALVPVPIADAELDHADGLALGLLQVESRLQPLRAGTADSAALPGPLNYDDSKYWNPTVLGGLVTPTLQGCELPIPNRIIESGATTRFVFGACPFLLSGERRLMHLGLDLLKDGTTAPGYNPSLVPASEALRSQVPRARWLAVLRAGDEHRAFSTCKHPGVALSNRAAGQVPSWNLTSGTFRHSPGYLQDAIARENWTFELLPRSFLAVLDEDMEVLTKSAITMRGAEGVYDHAAVQDARIMQVSGDRILLGFQPYALELAQPAKDANFSYRTQESVSWLHYEATDTNFEAWVDRQETRLITDCPARGFVAPGPKKNLGFFRVGNATYALDWIYPTRVGRLDLGELDGAKASSSQHFAPLCFGYEPVSLELQESPWEGLESSRLFGRTEAVVAHNGTPLVWIEALGEWLGVGHLLRHFGRKGMPWFRKPHYTQVFYTIAGDLTQGAPFRLSRLSPEFCIESASRPGECEVVQVVTSALLADADTLQLGYGVMDCESYVLDVSLGDLLPRLVELH